MRDLHWPAAHHACELHGIQRSGSCRQHLPCMLSAHFLQLAELCSIVAGAWLSGAPRGVGRACLGAPQRLQALPRALPQHFSRCRPCSLRSRPRRNVRVAVGDATMLQSGPVRRVLRSRHGTSPTHARDAERSARPTLRSNSVLSHTCTHTQESDGAACRASQTLTEPDPNWGVHSLACVHVRSHSCLHAGGSAIAGAWLGMSVGIGATNPGMHRGTEHGTDRGTPCDSRHIPVATCECH